MDGYTRSEFAFPFGHPVEQESTAEETADATLTQWTVIGSSLVPILGPRGFAAVSKRSLELAGAKHPWLADLARLDDDADIPVTGEALRAAVARQKSKEAVHGSQTYVAAIQDLLSSLVGPSLTERLLRKVWTQPAWKYEALLDARPAAPDAPSHYDHLVGPTMHEGIAAEGQHEHLER